MKNLKYRLLGLMAVLLVFTPSNAQSLVLSKRVGTNWNSNWVTMKNKPNGIIYRLREDVQCQDLPRVEEVENLKLIIAEPIDMGWMALYRLPLGADSYNFVVVLYNHEKQPVQTLNLCDIASNYYCEVQDVRWDAQTHHLLFNMACPSYSSQINGRGSKLYCYDVEKKDIIWETGWLTSNDIFILDEKFVYCSYGFTSEKDYLFLLDKFTGKVYSKIPMAKKVHYLELKEIDGKKSLYVIDYSDNLFIYHVVDKSSSSTNSDESKVFTVVYATSSDGFLNVRSQPSTQGEIIGQLYIKSHDLGNGVLIKQGATWSKVKVGNTTGWVYNKYLGRQTWYDGKGSKALYARHDLNVYAENFSGEGERPIFTTLKAGTLIADRFEEEGDYYVLMTGHDNLFIKKSDAIVK